MADKRSSHAMKMLVLGALFVPVLAIRPVQASPLLVTFDPNAIPGVSGLGTFQADNYNLSDFAVATITNSTGQFVENGTLQLLTFLDGSTTVAASTSGLRNGGGASSYGLYMTFAATGYVGVGGGAFVLGSGLNRGFFQTVSYTLSADPGNTDTVLSTGVLTDNGTPDVTLATGGLAGSGVNKVSVDEFTPSADVLLSILKSALGNGFFQNPVNLAFQEDAFTNTTSVADLSTDGVTTTVNIHGGGGNGTFLPAAVPEPSSLLLLGMGALTLAARARSRRKI